MAASLIRNTRFDQPSESLQSVPNIGFISDFVGRLKDVLQGACSGLLALMGATHLTSDISAFGELGSDIDALDRIWQTVAAEGIMGPVELLAGTILFFAARRTVSRTIGLFAFIVFVTAYSNGYSVADLLSVSANWLETLAAVSEPIPNSVASQ